MAEPQRRSQDQRLRTPRPPIFDGVMMAIAMAALTILGQQLPYSQNLQLLWPTMPLLLGAMLRFSMLSHGWSWLGSLLGLIGALCWLELPWLSAIWLALGPLLSCLLGFLVLQQLAPHSRSLHSPPSVLHLLLACAIASVAEGTFCAFIAPLVRLELPARDMLLWFSISLTNYMALLPVVLTLPRNPVVPSLHLQALPQPTRMDLRLTLPTLSLLLSLVAAWTLHTTGEPILTLPALLWCGITYPLFGTAALTGAVGMVFFLGSTQGWLGGTQGTPPPPSLIELLSLTALILAPLMVASMMAAHRALEHRLRVMADFDALTRLPVRHAFFQWGHQLLQRRRAERLPVTLFLIDVDQLHAINSTYGHAVGDKVLAMLGRHLLRSFRRQDCIGRLGGEEFGVILSNKTGEDAKLVIERICMRFAMQPIQLEHGETLHCTISIGGVTAPRASNSLPSLLTQAEQALRVAKSKGRGQWELQQAVTTPARTKPDASRNSTAE